MINEQDIIDLLLLHKVNYLLNQYSTLSKEKFRNIDIDSLNMYFLPILFNAELNADEEDKEDTLLLKEKLNKLKETNPQLFQKVGSFMRDLISIVRTKPNVETFNDEEKYILIKQLISSKYLIQKDARFYNKLGGYYGIYARKYSQYYNDYISAGDDIRLLLAHRFADILYNTLSKSLNKICTPQVATAILNSVITRNVNN